MESTERIDAARHTTEGRIDCLCSVAEVKHGPLPMVAQAIISVDSCIAKRRPFCGFEKLKARRLLLSMLKSKCFDHYFHFKLRFYILGYKAGGFWPWQ